MEAVEGEGETVEEATQIAQSSHHFDTQKELSHSWTVYRSSIVIKYVYIKLCSVINVKSFSLCCY